MAIDDKLHKEIHTASLNTPDPERAERNLVRFAEQVPEDERLTPDLLEAAAGLFSVSQFLAHYCIANPGELYFALDEIKEGITRESLEVKGKEELVFSENMTQEQMMKALRRFRKRCILRITLRDLARETDISSTMEELTVLAEVMISIALEWSLMYNRQKFGAPAESTVSLISLGKLGGEELNYSSDVDLIAVYDNEEGQTEGALNLSGVMSGRISNHEFYCKVVEFFSRLLSAQTEDGVAFRVDLRLRPQGQKGDIALPLKAYRTYYESWGRTWERMALIRARPVAGDADLGTAFLEMIRPFVWKSSMDFTEIEEIRRLKKQIDSTFDEDDIKRGYGGIREAEFFVQTFQILYGGDHDALKTFRMSDAINALKTMKIVPDDELATLGENYLYLRRVEHYLQMKEDLQTHTLPSSDKDNEILARALGFQEKEGFLADLKLKRMQVKNMYNSLLGTQEDVHAESLNLLEGNLNDHELSGYLLFRGVKDAQKGMAAIKGINEHMEEFRTMSERSVIREVLPQMIERALTSEAPDRVLAGLEGLISSYRIRTAHLNAVKAQPELMMGIINIFSFSPYLSRIFLSNQYYLNILIEEWSILKTLRVIEERLGRAVEGAEDLKSVLAGFRRMEEIRIGILFLLDILNVEDLCRGLSHLAEAIIKTVLNEVDCKGLSVIALGTLGGREMTFGSDLDIVFVSETPEAMAAAEKVLKVLTAYTDMGMLYSVDTRLRPDGARGILAKDIEGYRAYYMKNAQNWEIQALLKARPVGGNQGLGRSFINMAKEVILQRGKDIKKTDIAEMRSRIMKELAHESKGMDIKLGPGGIGEIEFYVQLLQLRNAREFPEVLVQNTLTAISRLAKKQVISPSEKNTYYKSYKYFRKIQTYLRLNEEHVIAEGTEVTALASKLMKHKSQKEFLSRLEKVREDVLSAIRDI
jgi:glutamate-ammonia-ligase adenylyltransferase